MNIYQDIISAKRNSRHPKMARADRAKIFAPFSALRGLDESLAARELRYVPRPEIAPDRAEQLNRRLRAFRRGDQVTVTWFECQKTADGEDLGLYRVTAGEYLASHPASGVLLLTNAKIRIGDIVDLGGR